LEDKDMALLKIPTKSVNTDAVNPFVRDTTLKV